MLTLKKKLLGLAATPSRGPAHAGGGFSSPSAPVSIEYCLPGNYERVARDLAGAIREEFGVEARLVPSRGGVFEVRVDERLVFSKRANGRFPARDEIFYHVGERCCA